MRITKEEYDQLQIFKREFNLMCMYLMSNPAHFVNYTVWRSLQKDTDDSNP